MLLPLQFETNDSSFTDLEKKVEASLPVYLEEEEAYYKPINTEDWLNEWDFKRYNPNIYSHGFYQYPAKFIPQLARKILRVFTDEESTV